MRQALLFSAGILIGIGAYKLAEVFEFPLPLTKRAVDHVYGVSVVIETPAGKDVYFRWCDPEGYMMFANGFNEASTITAIADSRCKGVR